MFARYGFLIGNRFLSKNRNFSNIFGLNINEEVRSSLECDKAVVALESTIITHGMPYPENVRCALDVEEAVRSQGAVPATVAIINGEIKVGLTSAELNLLGDVEKSRPHKVSRRDMSYVVSNKLNGGTTVSGTLIAADKARIPVFATGGIGGVHRDGHVTFDVSADLTELGRTGVAVVSSGVKSILDIPKTLEFLETQGVFVATFGDSKDFPAFYCRKSGHLVPYSIQSALEAAQIILANRSLGLQSGMLFAVPVPEQFAMDENLMERVVQDALKRAAQEGICGKQITPFLLARIAEITGGKSLETNMALIKNNATTAAKIAVELTKLKKEQPKKGSNFHDSPGPVVIGGSNLDFTIKLNEDDLKTDGRIHYGKFALSAGGVARNICEALQKLECTPMAFISALGGDHQATILKSLIPKNCHENIETFPEENTGQCAVVIEPDGECRFIIGDMDIHARITPDMIWKHRETICKAPLIIFDGNLPIETVEAILKLAQDLNIPVLYEPTDVVISSKPFETPYWKSVKFITPNVNELRHIATFLKIPYEENYSSKLDEAANIGRKLVSYVDNVIVTLGSEGLLIARKGRAIDSLLRKPHDLDLVSVRHYPVKLISTEIVNVSGAGDCLASGLIAATLNGLNEEQSVAVGFEAAQTALLSHSPVANILFDKTHKIWKCKAIHHTLV